MGEVWVLLRNGIDGQPPRAPVARTHVVDQYIRGPQQSIETLPIRRQIEIENRAPLVRVAIPVRDRLVVGWLGGRPFDAHHVGAKIGEDARTERTTQIRQVDDA
jgi:hypothetical protein